MVNCKNCKFMDCSKWGEDREACPTYEGNMRTKAREKQERDDIFNLLQGMNELLR